MDGRKEIVILHNMQPDDTSLDEGMEMIPPEYRRCPCDRGVYIAPDFPRCYLCEEDKAAAERRERYLLELRDRAAVAVLAQLFPNYEGEVAVAESVRISTALVAALYPEEAES